MAARGAAAGVPRRGANPLQLSRRAAADVLDGHDDGAPPAGRRLRRRQAQRFVRCAYRRGGGGGGRGLALLALSLDGAVVTFSTTRQAVQAGNPFAAAPSPAPPPPPRSTSSAPSSPPRRRARRRSCLRVGADQSVFEVDAPDATAAVAGTGPSSWLEARVRARGRRWRPTATRRSSSADAACGGGRPAACARYRSAVAARRRPRAGGLSSAGGLRACTSACQLPAVEEEADASVHAPPLRTRAAAGIVEEWYNAATTKPAVTTRRSVHNAAAAGPAGAGRASRGVGWDASLGRGEAREAATAADRVESGDGKREAEARAMRLRRRRRAPARAAAGVGACSRQRREAAGRAAAATRLLDACSCGCSGQPSGSPGREDAALARCGDDGGGQHAAAAATAAAAAAAAASAAIAASSLAFGSASLQRGGSDPSAGSRAAARGDEPGSGRRSAQMLMMGGHAPAMVMNAVHTDG